ncbi:MAG: hypothetical protein AB7S72_11890 [Draconibacterium sp.]
MLGVFLVFLTSAVIHVDSDGTGNLPEQTTETHNPNSSFGCIGSIDDVYEDEQIHQIASTIFFAVPVISIAVHKNSNLISQPFLLPWEPPRI